MNDILHNCTWVDFVLVVTLAVRSKQDLTQGSIECKCMFLREDTCSISGWMNDSRYHRMSDLVVMQGWEVPGGQEGRCGRERFWPTFPEGPGQRFRPS